MKEPYGEGPASHTGPESCVVGGNARGEALTGEDAGQPLSSEIRRSACRPCPDRGKAIRAVPLSREASADARKGAWHLWGVHVLGATVVMDADDNAGCSGGCLTGLGEGG